MADEKVKKPGSGLPIALAVITLIAGGAGAGLGFMVAKPASAEKGSEAKSASTETATGPGSHGLTAEHGKPKEGHGEPRSQGGGHGNSEAGSAAKSSSTLPKLALKFRDIAAITTNLAGEKAPWVRLEGGLVYEQSIETEITVLTSQITEDFIAYLRSVKINQISGGGGLQALVEDLNERARVRSGGKVHQFVISGFIVE